MTAKIHIKKIHTMKKRTGLNEAFQVKNNAAGRAELKVVKSLFKGTNVSVIVRGRNPDRRKAVEKAGLEYHSRTHRSVIPVKLASYFAVYLIHKQTKFNFHQIIANPLKVVENVERVKYLENMIIDARIQASTAEMELHTLKQALRVIAETVK